MDAVQQLHGMQVRTQHFLVGWLTVRAEFNADVPILICALSTLWGNTPRKTRDVVNAQTLLVDNTGNLRNIPRAD